MTRGVPMEQADNSSTTLPDVGYYYPEPYWPHGEADFIKGLLLFFDKLAFFFRDTCTGVTG